MTNHAERSIDAHFGASVPQIDNGDPMVAQNGLDRLEEGLSAASRVANEVIDLLAFPVELTVAVGSFALSRARLAHQDKLREAHTTTTRR